MKLMTAAVLLVAGLLPPAARAAPPAPAAQAAPAAGQLVTVNVNGLVCDFCARSIEAMLKKRPDVAGVHVDLDQGEVHVRLRPGATLTDAQLQALITDSGYSVTKISRSPVA
jgi:copper chaperone CopZ